MCPIWYFVTKLTSVRRSGMEVNCAVENLYTPSLQGDEAKMGRTSGGPSRYRQHCSARSQQVSWLSEPLMSLLIRYAHIPFYFCFSFTFPTLPIHHYTPPLRRDCMTIALTPSDWSHLFDGHMTYNSHVFTPILSISNVPPPAVWPIMSSRTAWSGTFYSFAICSHSCLPFVFNLPVFTFQKNIIAEALTNCLYESPPELRFRTYASHYFALHRTATIPPSLLATIHLETIPYPQIAPPQSPIGFILTVAQKTVPMFGHFLNICV